MNPLMHMMMNQTAGRPPVQAQPRNIMAMALAAAMSGQTPQQFLSSLPEFQGVNLNNIQGTAQQLCQQRGIDYNTAINQVKSNLNTKR